LAVFEHRTVEPDIPESIPTFGEDSAMEAPPEQATQAEQFTAATIFTEELELSAHTAFLTPQPISVIRGKFGVVLARGPSAYQLTDKRNQADLPTVLAQEAVA
jgi:hypothetical protein